MTTLSQIQKDLEEFLCACVELAPIIIIITLYLLSAFLVSGSARAKPTWTQS